MPTSEVALRIFLILLPGFAAAYLVQTLTVRAKQTDLEKVIEALLFSFVIYISFYALHPRLDPTLIWGTISSSQGFHLLDLLTLFGVTLGWAFLLIWFVNKDGTRVLRKWGITERTSRSSVWNDVFQGDPETQIVQVELADGRSVQGIVGFYSDTPDESSIFLRSARWIGSDGEQAEIVGPGILLTKEAKIISISFLDPAGDANKSIS